MGLFTRNAKTTLPWIQLSSIEQLNEVLATSSEKPVLLFKHSMRCGISSMVLRSFESSWSSGNDLCEVYFLDLLKHRDVSSEIAVLTGVMHQSPQVVVLKGKEVVYEASHSSIDAGKIESLLK